jgi:DNA-binding PadR family transcriptional regulator
LSPIAYENNRLDQNRRNTAILCHYKEEKRKGWLGAEWRIQDGGREAKYYSLTREGRRQLAAETAGWKRLCDAISLVLEAEQ